MKVVNLGVVHGVVRGVYEVRRAEHPPVQSRSAKYSQRDNPVYVVMTHTTGFYSSKKSRCFLQIADFKSRLASIV